MATLNAAYLRLSISRLVLTPVLMSVNHAPCPLAMANRLGGTAEPAAAADSVPAAEPLVAEAMLRSDPEQDNAHYVFLPATLLGRPVSLLLDTGTGFRLFLFQTALTQLGLTPPATPVDALTLGTLTVRAVPVTTGAFPLDTTHTPLGLPPLVGILGNFALPRYDLVFDGPARRVRLYQLLATTPPWTPTATQVRPGWLPSGFTPADCVPLRAPTARDYSVFFPSLVPGKAVTSWLDSGADETVMNVAAAKLLGITRHTPHLTAVQAGAVVYVVHDVPITLGGHHLVIPKIQVSQDTEAPWITLGLDAFQEWQLLISYSTRQICLREPPHPSLDPSR